MSTEETEDYLLTKAGLYYRPNNRGYTGIKLEAGLYRKAEECRESGVIAVHRDEAPDYSGIMHQTHQALI